MAEMTQGEAAIRIARAVTNGKRFEDADVPDSFRNLWDQISVEVADIRADGGEVDIPSDQGMW